MASRRLALHAAHRHGQLALERAGLAGALQAQQELVAPALGLAQL
jgi:hypothetical protein